MKIQLLKNLWYSVNKGLFFFLLLGFFSCQDEAVVAPPSEAEGFPKGVFITNEGAFNNGNASITFYNPATKEVQEKIFETANGKPIGDVLQSITIADQQAYLVVNNSSKIEMVNIADFKIVKTIDNLTSPRYLQIIDESTAYVSDIFKDAIAVIDLNTYQEKNSIAFGGWSEEMVKVGNEVFVTQPSFFGKKSSNQLFIINTVSNTVNDSIEVGFNPIALELDKNNKLWVLCNGESAEDKFGGLYKVNTTSKVVELSLPFKDKNTSFGPQLELNGAKDQIYFLKIEIYTLSINATELPITPLIKANGRDLYGLGVHPETGEIYVGDSGNFAQKGTVTIHSEDGQELSSFKAGVGVNGFYFITR